MNFRNHTLWFAGLAGAVLVLVLLGFWVTSKNPVSVIELQSEPEVLQEETISRKTYTNSEYDFSFEYPEEFEFRLRENLKINPVALINLWDKAQTEGYVKVNVSREPADLSKCLSPGSLIEVEADAPAEYSPIKGNSQTVIINGTDFLRFDLTEFHPTLGPERYYATIKNGACYEIELTAFPGTCVNSGCEDRRWSTETEFALLEELDKIAQTFRFTQ